MNEIEKRKLITDLIKRCPLGLIATVHSNNSPEAAIIGISQRESLELIFDTFKETRKYKNLKQNSRVAVVVGWDENITIQYEGVALELEGSEREVCEKVHLAKIPSEIKFIHQGASLFKITPTWVRYSDFTKQPSEIFELSFEN